MKKTKGIMIIVKDILREKATWFILAVIAMTSLVACTKMEDMAPPRKITFGTGTYRPQTKADPNAPDGSVMHEFSDFKCMAFLHADGYQGDNETQLFFGSNGETIYAYNGENQVVTTSGDVAYWAPSHDYYWPKSPSSYINFVGWYDTQANNSPTLTETTSNGISSTLLQWADYTVGTQDNLLYADEAWRYNENPKSIYHLDGENASSYYAVPMLFHHALSKICFKVAVSRESAENVTGGRDKGFTYWEVTLSNITLAGVYDTGTLSLTNSDPENATTKAWTGSWSTEGQTTKSISMTPPTANNGILTTTATDILEMQSVLPQAVTPEMVLSFDYNIVTKFNTTEYSREKIHASIALSSFSEHITSWEMNKKITYTITINPETKLVKIDPAMVDWIAQSGGSTSI